MSRLLTEEEIQRIVKNARTLTCAIEAVAQAQDDLTAHIVATQIFKELEEAFEPTVPMSIDYEKYQAIKEKHEVLDD